MCAMTTSKILFFFFQQKLLSKYELFKNDPTTIWEEDESYDLMIKQANGKDLRLILHVEMFIK